MSKLSLGALALTLTALTALPPAKANNFCLASTSGCTSAPQCAWETTGTECGTRPDGTPRVCTADGLGCCGCL